jgi:cob(I)alamin adenosyltransferase
LNQGFIHIYCGDGKGKTSAALGLALRAAGRGLKVLILRLMKDSDSGEVSALQSLKQVTVIPAPEKLSFVFRMTPVEKEEYCLIVRTMFDTAVRLVRDEQADVLIIDEACSAVRSGLLDEQALIDFLKTKPGNLEIVLTGRNPTNELLALADYVSEIQKIKHPYDRKIRPRQGVEW